MTNYPRHLSSALDRPASRGKVALIFGARQTGKSTLLRQRLLTRDVYLNLQDIRERLQYERSPGHLTEMLLARGPEETTVFIDEIQKVPALLDEVQFLYDRHRGRFKFVLTGSSARKLTGTSANLLPGRAHAYRLCPLILPERCGRRESRILPMHTTARIPAGFPEPALEELLLFGNLPGVILEPDASRALTLESYAEVYLEEEIRREALVRNVGAFQQFLELAALESGNLVNLSSLSRQSGIAVATLRSFYQVLIDTFVGYRIPAFGERARKRVLTTPRFLFFDTGVRNAVARLMMNHSLLQTQAGQLFENWVGLELIHRCWYAGRPYRVSFWRTAHHAEVDFVLETPEECVPIEVKWTVSPHETDARHLKLFLDTYPRKAQRGFIVCRCPHPLQLSKTIQAIPWWMI